MALPGAVLNLDTPLYTVVPIAFGEDGYMSGDAGQLASVLGSQKDRGRWSLDGDRLCYKWFRWFDAEKHCATIERDGQKIYWKRDDGEVGTATLEEHRKVAPIQATSGNVPKTGSKTTIRARNSDVGSISVPVLVKFPTLAVRPAKTAAVLSNAE